MEKVFFGFIGIFIMYLCIVFCLLWGRVRIFIKGIFLFIKVDFNVDKFFKVFGILLRDNEFVIVCIGIILCFKFYE